MAPILKAVDKTYARGLMWFRRDLRIDDNAALYHALRQCREVVCLFVFDRDILDDLPRADRRVEFIRESLVELEAGLKKAGGGLVVVHEAARDALPRMAQALQVQAVFANRDDEPYALARDAHVLGALADVGVVLQTFKDQAIFERQEVLTQAGQTFSVYTPYKRAWLAKLDDFFLKPYPVRRHADALIPTPVAHAHGVPSLEALGFERTNLKEIGLLTGLSGAQAQFDDFVDRIDRYEETRNLPAVKGPSYLGVHLRFGTLSVRQAAGMAHQLSVTGDRGAAVWLSEIIWRDFFFQILANHPRLFDDKGVSRAFKPEYDRIQWHHGKHADGLFAAWCEGRTGYPIVDAAMRQINQSGYMHNRLRLIASSFLCKDLGLDWRRGERYFAIHLNDFELSSNNGNWQWASSSGCDAQPYFRIFNPVTQSQKFDPEGKFIRRYVPELAKLPDGLLHAPWTAKAGELEALGVRLGTDYPRPVVDHAVAREETLRRYSVVRGARKAA